MFKYMYGSDTSSRTQAYEWHRRFREGRESVEDDKRSERPQTSHTSENIEEGFFSGTSAIQHLANWHNVRDRTGTDILKMLKRLFLSHQIHFQWIPSHVNIDGNEIADSLARAVAGEITTPAAPLTLFGTIFKV
ncbi:RNase H domain-containing protein [Trichonephila clavipes]|nr:RNase H domain-containing protein [Trichonephila clavipes]